MRMCNLAQLLNSTLKATPKGMTALWSSPNIQGSPLCNGAVIRADRL